MMNAKRQGFTLAELLVVTLIGSVVLTAVYQTLTIQERSNRQQIAVVSTQQNTRMALALLSSDLREVSATDGDILEATSTSVRYRALRKAAVVCTKDYVSHAWADVVRVGEAFVANDSVLFFQDNNKATAADDNWAAGVVSSVMTPVTNCAGYTGLKQRLNFPANTLAAVDTGALVRSYVTVGFRVVNSGSGSTLWRMQSDSVAVVDSLSSIANEGLRLRYFNANGAQITPTTAALRAQIMRIEIKARANTVGGESGNRRMFSDSLLGNVFLRGNRKTS